MSLPGKSGQLLTDWRREAARQDWEGGLTQTSREW